MEVGVVWERGHPDLHDRVWILVFVLVVVVAVVVVFGRGNGAEF